MSGPPMDGMYVLHMTIGGVPCGLPLLLWNKGDTAEADKVGREFENSMHNVSFHYSQEVLP